jgi:hypothetical protein
MLAAQRKTFARVELYRFLTDAVEKGILRGSQSNIDSRSKVNAQS